MAINPIRIGGKEFDFIAPSDPGTIHKTLTFKHRNSTEISAFLLHFIKHYCGICSSTSINTSNDAPLTQSTFPSRLLPTLVRRANHVDDETILNAIHLDLVNDIYKDVFVVHDRDW